MSDQVDETAHESDRLSVLIYEHSGVQRQLLSDLLVREGFDVQAVSSGEQAMEKFESAQYDLFITGIEVGATSGIELSWLVKSKPASAHVYIIVMTASGDPRRLVESLDSGADDYIRKPFDEVELRARLRAASRIIRMQRRLANLANTDPLTGAANRRSFMAALETELSRARRHDLPMAVVMLDLDHFKSINDTYGHASGDAVLVNAVRTINDSIRRHDILGRLGGEEFCILLPETDPGGAVEAADKVRRQLAAISIDSDHGPLQVTASFGVANLTAANASPDALLHAADEAVYAAKEAGRNRVCSAVFGNLGEPDREPAAEDPAIG